MTKPMTNHLLREYLFRAEKDRMDEIEERVGMLTECGRKKTGEIVGQALIEVALRMAREDGVDFGPDDPEKIKIKDDDDDWI